jgi:uncharacterized protein (DUF924 family)
MDPVAEEILTFWFGTTDLAAEMERREVWFRATAEFDRQLARQFADVHEQAASGAFDPFVHAPEECLALIIALDQFPRNIFRGTSRAFAADHKARDIARYALGRGYDRRFARWPKTFVYLPFEHSEELADQEKGIQLDAALGDEEGMKAARGHHHAIRRFGRFPHRNAVLGRANTPEEEEYLKEPPLWGKTAAEVEAIEKRKGVKDAPA